MEKRRKNGYRAYLYDIGDTFETRHGIMTVIGKLRIQRSDKINRKHYTLQCERGHQYNVNEEYLKNGRLRTCKRCNHPVIIESDPAFATWFVDSSIPRERSHGCHDKVDFYCQLCGKVVREKSINNIYKRQQVPCPYCANGVSYPERYVSALFSQMQIPFVHQYTAKFTQNGMKAHYKYDFYDRARQLVIETHGAQHFEPGTFERVGGYSLEEIKQIDIQKEKYATEVLGLNYIYLDCRKSDPDWIRQEVIRKLDSYPLETVDWEAVRLEANSSVVLQLIELSRQGYTQKQMGEIVRMSPSTVCQKLQKAIKDGLYDGITPRMLRVEENKRAQQAARERYLKELQRRELLRQAVETRRAEQARNRKASYREQLEKIRSIDTSITVLDPYVNGCTGLHFLCAVCHQVFMRTPKSMVADSTCVYCKKLAEIKQRAETKYGNQYEIMGVYTDSRTPLQIRHKMCGNIFQKTVNDFFKSGCPVCGKRERAEKSRATRRSRGTEKFYTLLPDIERRGYIFVGETFAGLGKRNAFLCDHCGEIWWTTAYSILNGRNHICISHCKKKTHAEYVEQVHKLVGEEYSVMTEYCDAFTPVKMRHNSCGLEYLVSPAHFTSTGRRCPICSKSAAFSNMAAEQLEERISFAQKLHVGWEQNRLLGSPSKGYLDYVWTQKLEDVKVFHAQHGHIDIPDGYMVNSYNLGGWITDQRKLHSQQRLPADRVEALDALGIKWRYKEENWHRIYGQVKRYLLLHGTVRLTKESTKEERKYYYWINDQSELHRKGRLSPERSTLLRNIGIEPEYKADIHFDIMCEKLRCFVELHGHCIVPLDEGSGEEMPLGLWSQRMRLQMSSNKLSAQRTARLLELGLPTNNKEAKFQYKLTLLRSFWEKHGHLRISQSCIENGNKLGKWINSLRVSYSKGKLPLEKIKALEDIDMIWEVSL